MSNPVAFLLFVSLLAIVFPKGNEGYNQEEHNPVEEEFIAWDRNNDGYVDRDELSTEMKPDYLKDVFDRFDFDGDGKLNLTELIKESLYYPESGWNRTDAFYVDK